MMAKKTLEGIIVPLSTLLTNALGVDKQGMKRLIEHTVAGGVHGIFVLGSCGEGVCFDDRESNEIVECVVKNAGGRVPVYANATRNSTQHTLQVARDFRSIGVDAVVLLPHFYFNGIRQEEIMSHYATVADNMPTVIYNLPSICKCAVSPATLEVLAAHENILGIKDSSQDMGYFAKSAKIMPALQGSDDLVLKSMNVGGRGGVPGLSNIVPNAFVQLYNAVNAGKNEEAEIIQTEINKMADVVYRLPPNAQVGVKQGLAYLGIGSTQMMPPLAQITIEQARRINDYLSSCKLICKK